MYSSVISERVVGRLRVKAPCVPFTLSVSIIFNLLFSLIIRIILYIILYYINIYLILVLLAKIRIFF
nr:MAG TPA: hypothetical protein [Crassvirales sp.]